MRSYLIKYYLHCCFDTYAEYIAKFYRVNKEQTASAVCSFHFILVNR